MTTSLQLHEHNLLPCDGIVNYYGPILSTAEADSYLNTLLNTIPWKNDETKIFGRHIITKRKAAWYGDETFDYAYSGTTKKALPWTKELLELKELAEKTSNSKFNSCLLNLYHNGDEGMSWHSDDEKSLGKNTTIASISLGAERKFAMKHKVTKESVSIQLESGSLIVMKSTTQTHWLHSIPKTKKVLLPRINLTYRTIVV